MKAPNNRATLLRVPPGSPAARWLPAASAVPAGVGLVPVLPMKANRSRVGVRMSVGTNPDASPPPTAGGAAMRPQGWLG
ncbi:MAG: hypothetical protein QOI74_225 [Micromonosporaceae bacterium]|nr:hypothetical protein [Micromonosporaceae bacterium]